MSVVSSICILSSSRINAVSSSLKKKPASLELESVPSKRIASVANVTSSASSRITLCSYIPTSLPCGFVPKRLWNVSSNRTSNVDASIGENLSSGATALRSL